MEAAGCNFQKTRARLLPSLSGNGSASRTGSEQGTSRNQYAASLDARWEVSGEWKEKGGHVRMARIAGLNVTNPTSAYSACRSLW